MGGPLQPLKNGLLQYHYRPGTVTSFLSRILDRHAKRRRGMTVGASSACHVYQ